MKNQKLHWSLYSDEKQTNLLACAEEEDQIDFESQYYPRGVWFEYDVEVRESGSIHLHNERKYKKKVRFPDEPLPRPKYGEDAYEMSLSWASMKETVGTADIR